MRPLCVLLVLATWLWSTPAGSKPPWEILRVGYTTFERPDFLIEKSSALELIESYLESISERSRWDRGFEVPLDFAVHLGNYYQTYSWLRDGYLDAAVVSPFVAYLLRNRGFVPLAEFKEFSDQEYGHRPLIASSSTENYDPSLTSRAFSRKHLCAPGRRTPTATAFASRG